MPKPKILELDLARAAAILAVLVIHGTADACCYYIPVGSRSQVIYLALNKLSNFAVPLFIILSGFVLFYRYEAGWNVREALSFYRKRLQYVVIPYLVWSVFYYFYGPWVDDYSLAGFTGNAADFLDKLLWADISSGYHLYFIIIIAQFYLLFPLLMSAVKLWPWFGRHFVWIGILTQAVFYVIHTRFHHFEHYPSLWFNYVGLFCIGGYMGLRYEKIRQSEKHLWWVFALTLSAGFAFFLLHLLANHHIRFNVHLFDVFFYTYPVGIAFSFLWIGRKMLNGMPRLSALLTSLGAVSFGVYFMHPAVLSLLRIHFSPDAMSAAYHVFTVGAFAVALAVPWSIVSLLKRWRWSWILFGR